MLKSRPLEFGEVKSKKGLSCLFNKWVIKRAQEKGAHLLQLTTDKQWPEVIHFFKKIELKASHEGMKIL